MADIFGFNNVTSGSVFSSDEGHLTIGNLDSGANVLLIQNWQVQYSQNITPMYEIGSNRVFWSRAHAAGSLSIGRIVSHEDVLGQLSNGCRATNMTITASNGLCNGEDIAGGHIKLLLKGVVLVGVGWSGQVQQAHINENMQAYFAGLERVQG